MTIVAGADFGTLNVRVTIMDTKEGRVLAAASADYPLERSPDDPLLARQAHADHIKALTRAVADAVAAAGIDGHDIAAFAADTTGSSVVAVDRDLQPLDDYYMWCDHRAHAEAEEITERARAEGIEALEWCGGVYSHEWGYAKLLHFLRHNPDKRAHVAAVLEHCDMIAATLCGIKTVGELPRSICAMGHKWMWGERWGGLPDQDFLSRVDPLLDGANAWLAGRYGTSAELAGRLAPAWAEALGLKAGIPVPIGALDAHWDAAGSGCRPGEVINVIGTSTCIMAIGDESFSTVPGLCGAVPGSVIPGYVGIEAGQSATGDIFEAIARRAGSDVATLSRGLADYGPGATGLMRVPWDNGDRTVLVRSDLGGITLGWDLAHTAADELHAAIEGMALHARIIIERMAKGGLTFGAVINAGGIPQKNPVLNQIYADVLAREIRVPTRSPVGVGACIFAGLAAGAFASVEEGQKALGAPTETYRPRVEASARYDALFDMFSSVYFGFGAGEPVALETVLPRLRAFRLGD